MIPRWKLARELDRTAQQLKALAGLFWEPFVQRSYDRNRGSRLKITPGNRPLRDKVLVYLLYQPDRILDSTLETCRILEKQGYSTLIVSNAPLSAESLSRLTEVSWQVMERPNYGYDFGGYRDGILHLMDIGLQPQWLLVMNDSIWYPLGEADTLVPRLEASGLDVTGAIVHRSFRKTLLRRKAARVIESYLFLFNRKALKSAAFRDFWVKYRLSSNKYNAVHRGERRVAERMLAAGLTADGLFGRDEFLAALSTRDEMFLRRTLQYGSYTDDNLSNECDALLSEPAGSADWRLRALDHVARTSLKRNFHGAFVFASMELLDMPFIKKGTGTFLKRTYGTLYSRMRARYLAAVMAKDLPAPRPEILAEILMRDGNILASNTDAAAETSTVKGAI